MQIDEVSPAQAWICLRFTHLSLNSIGYAFNSSPALAVTHQQQVWQCNSLALEFGIVDGMSISHSLMLNPNLQLHERDIHSETKKMQELSHWAYCYSSLVSRKKDNLILLEVEKSRLLFNNLESIINLIKKDSTSFKIDVNLGLAQTPKAAIVLSLLNHQELSSSYTALNQAKLEYLEQNTSSIKKLRHCGFQTLDDIKAIPRSELGSRFGQEFLIYLQQLWGDLADPQLGITPPETFSAGVDFAEPISNIIWIQQQLDHLLDDLVNFINSRQLLCCGFTWHFYHENNRLVKTVHIEVSTGKTLLSSLKELTALKLESINFDWEFSSITLSSTQLLPMQLFNNDLFNPTHSQQQFQQLLDKLTNRLGHSAVFQLKTTDQHLPELSNVRVSISSLGINETPSGYYEENNASRRLPSLKDEPLYILETPKRLLKRDQLPLLDGPLNIIHGPNRISSHWWSTLQSRDYFIVRQTNGRLLWVFFDRVARHWFLHGVYA